VRALIGIDPCPMAAAIVRATDQEAANASGAHLCKRDFLLAGEFGHAIEARHSRLRKLPYRLGPEWEQRHRLSQVRSSSDSQGNLAARAGPIS